MRRSAALKPLAWLVTIALLAQSWLVPLATALVSAEIDGIVICTADGFEIIDLPDDLRSPLDTAEGRDEQDRHHLDCAACLVQAISQALSESSFDGTSVVWPDVSFDAVSSCTLPPTSRPLGAHWTRAPPTA